MNDLDSYLLACERIGPLTPEGRRALRDILGHGAIQAAISIVLSEMQGKMAQFRGLQYHTPDGVAKATTLKGELDGMNRVLTVLWDEAHNEETS